MSAENNVNAENNGAEAQNKQREIVAMFDEIAHNYDLANRILSFGIDTRWRKEACEKAIKLCDKKSLDILDIACGTGDMIATWLKVAKSHGSVEFSTKNDSCGSIFDEKSWLCSHERGNKTKASIDEASGKLPDLSQKDNRTRARINSIRGIDPSAEMLKIARQKLPPSVILQNGEAKDLRIDSDSADILSIAYGLRNVVEVDLALSEFHRVLRKNGILVILEFSKKDNENIFDKIARFYTKRILPYIGGFISRNYKAYKYLPDSVDDFLSLEQIASKLRALGFEMKISKRYFGNVCSLIIAQKIK